MADVDFAALFAAEKGHLRTSSETGLLPDGSLVLAWERIPQSHSKEAADWFRTNRKTLTNPLVNNIARTGVYRLQTIEEEVDPRRDADELRTLVATYAKGFDEVLVWAQGRIVAGTDWSTSDRFLSVEFPNQNKDDLPAIIASVRGATYTTPTIGGSDTFPGDWKVLAADVRMAEDGSSTLTLHIGRPEFRLTSFSDFGLPSHNTITYIWNVPKAEAQGLITSFEREGVTVTASYSGSSDVAGTVDLVVTDNDVDSVELNNIEVATSCDTTTTTQYRWGLTKAEVETFVLDYKTQTAGTIQDVRVSFSTDSGKYSVVGTKRVKDDPADPEWTLTIATDFDATEQTWFRWSVTQGDVATFISTNDFDNNTDGKLRSLRVSRNPDCTYDFVAVETTKTLNEGQLEFTVGTRYDTDQTQTYIWTQTREQVDDIKDNYGRAGDETDDGVTRSVRVSRRGDLYYDVVVFIATRDQNEFTEPILMDTSKNVIQVDKYYWTIDRLRLDELVQAFRIEGPTESPEGAGEDEQNTVSRSARIVRNDDGSFNLINSKVEHQKVDQLVTHETGHEKETTTYTWNLDKVGLDAVLLELEDDPKTKTGARTVSVSKTDDDVYSVTVRLNRQKGQDDEVTWTIGDEEGQLGITNKIHFYFGLFLKPDDPDVPNPPPGQDEPITVESVITGVEADEENTEYSVSLGRNSDGTFDMVVRSTLDNGADIDDVTVGNEARFTTYQYKWAQNATDAQSFAEGLLDNTDHVGKSASIRRNRDGSFDVSLIKQTEKAFDHSSQVVQAGSNFTRTNNYNWGSDVGALPALAHVVGTSKTLQLSRDSNGNIDWVEQTTAVSEFTSDSYIHSKNVFPDGTVASQRSAKIFEGLQSIPVLDSLAGGRVEANYDPATGTYSGRIVTVTTVAGATPFSGGSFTVQKVVRMHTNSPSGARYYYDRQDTHDVLLTTDLASAIQHAYEGDAISFYKGASSGGGSGVESHKISMGILPGSGDWILVNTPA